MSHGQYLVLLVINVGRMYYRFSGFCIQANVIVFLEECIIVFQTPPQIPKKKDASNTTFHYTKFWL